mmetsp:Transcript_13914/g.15368  ORF Transcript_13914/g.15368 Transcript_13914/m.15368 type:complete len:894 (-) Transcript_13914:152-2833(-)
MLCKQCHEEQANMAKGLQAAIRNMDVHRVSTETTLKSFSSYFEHHTAKHRKSLGEFNSNLNLLGETILDPALQTPERKKLIDYVPAIKLKKWHTRCKQQQENLEKLFSSVKKRIQDIKIEVEQHKKAIEASVDFRVQRHSIDVAESAIKKIAQYIDTISQAIAKARVVISRRIDPDDAVLREFKDMLTVQDNTILSATHLDTQIKKIVLDFAAEKSKFAVFVHKKLQASSRVADLMGTVHSKFVAIREAMSKHRQDMSQLAFVDCLPTTYENCVTEVRRRKAWKIALMAELQRMRETIVCVRDKELQKRERFFKNHKQYIPKPLFPGLTDFLPEVKIAIDDFDTSLPNVAPGDDVAIDFSCVPPTDHNASGESSLALTKNLRDDLAKQEKSAALAQTELVKKEARIASLESELMEYKEKAKGYQTRVSDLEAKHATIYQSFMDSQHNLQLFQEQQQNELDASAIFKETAKEAEEKLKKQEEILAERERLLAEKNEKINSLETSVVQTEEKYAAMEKSAQDRLEALEIAKKKAAELEEKLIKTAELHQNTTGDKNQLEQSLIVQNKESDELRMKLIGVEKEKEEAENSLMESKLELNSITAEMKKFEEKLKAAQAQAKKAIEESKKNADAKRAIERKLEASVKIEDRKTRELEQEKNRLSTEMNMRVEKSKSLEASLKKEKQTVLTHKKELNKLKKDLQKSTRELKSLTQENEKLNKNIAKFRDELRDVQSEKSGVEEELILVNSSIKRKLEKLQLGLGLKLDNSVDITVRLDDVVNKLNEFDIHKLKRENDMLREEIMRSITLFNFKAGSLVMFKPHGKFHVIFATVEEPKYFLDPQCKQIFKNEIDNGLVIMGRCILFEKKVAKAGNQFGVPTDSAYVTVMAERAFPQPSSQ